MNLSLRMPKPYQRTAAALVCVALLDVLAMSQPGQVSSGTTAAPAPDERHFYVVQDMLRLCRPPKGFWVDLGAGQGQVAIPLIEATGNPVLMVDPDREALQKGLARAREKGLEERLFAVVGTAEALPFPDQSVDLVVSRGSIFFWENPAQGLREVYRVLRPGGKAYIGGGAGSGCPQPFVAQLIEERQAQLQGEEAEKWQRFVALRRPEQMHQWAQDAGLVDYQVMGQGALSADDKLVGQGTWLLFSKETSDNRRSTP